MIEIGCLGLLMLATLLGSARAHASPSQACAKRLVVALAPDVPDPPDDAFLSSLVGNHPGFRLTRVQDDDESMIVLDLAGPGPDDACESVIETLRRDGRVASVEPLPDDELPSVSVSGYTAPQIPESTVHVSSIGIGAFYWAARHDLFPWQILLPVEPDDPERGYDDLRAACLSAEESTVTTVACP